ncbi:MAG: type II toxin-antitoxin system VapC family toxin [Chloroflexi bacterium]|nr:type II toxin-antitoxin system VapC family toxin [Chloroflexota bacterium]
MASYLLDTNHVSKVLDGNQALHQRLMVASQQGDEVGISTTVLGELYFAAYASERQEQNRRRIEQLIAQVQVWTFDNDAAKEFGVIRAELRRKGKPIPPMDAQIAAVARTQGLTVVTADQHFAFVDNLPVENWLEPANP